MSKFTRELEELVANKVITPEVAGNIRAYYDKPSENRGLLVIAFGIIGALLVGMGVVLIIAHNWDDLSNPVKLVIGLTPLLIAQAAAGFVVIRQVESQAWREGVGVILIFAVATAIAIVGQVYNMGGSLEKFILALTVLSLPVMYLLKSRMASLLIWMLIGWYAMHNGFENYSDRESWYWPFALALLTVPFYIDLLRKNRESNSVSFHNWVVGIAVMIILIASEGDAAEFLLIPMLIALFSIFILIGQLPVFYDRKLINNAWLVGGSAGTILVLLFLTFDWFNVPFITKWWLAPFLYIPIAMFIIAGSLLYMVAKRIGYRNILSKSYTFIVFIPLFFIGLYKPGISILLTNLLLLLLGVFTIREGAMAGKLWKMNYGMLILSVLIACRFFDTDIPFVLRGLLFVAIGAGFFGMNYYMIRKRKISS